ncbi:hypothetical protein FRC03_012125 [Tulasnella sp. 419]|nr:hypothetical protein FRC03_012125 [Tulasnella sp. 419]
MVRVEEMKEPLLPVTDQLVDDKLIAEFDLEHTRAVQRRCRAKRWWRLLAASLLICLLGWHSVGYLEKPNNGLLDLHIKMFDEIDNILDPEDGHDCTRIETISEETHLLYNISTKPEKIGVLSRGPIAGNVTFEAGGTAGDDVEVDIVFRKPTHDHPDFKLEDPHPHPHPPPPPSLAICQWLTPDGEVKIVGLFAHPPHRHPRGPPPHGPPHRGHPPPPPPPPHETSEARDANHGHPFQYTGASFHYDRHPVQDASGQQLEKPKHCPHRPPPWHHGPYPPILADIVIRFPKKASIKEFGSSLALFKADVKDLESSVAFKKFELVNVGQPVTIKGLAADTVKIVSSRGGITAKVSTNDTLEVVSVGKPVYLNATLFSDSQDGVVKPSLLSIAGARAPVFADVKLETSSNKASTYTPSYEVKIANYNALSNITFLSQPLKSALSLRADTKAGEISASLAPEYEGSFELVGVGKVPVVNVNEDVDDPYGEGRKRSVEIKKTWWSLSGTVSWVKSEEALGEMLGHVKLVGAWAPITLFL